MAVLTLIATVVGVALTAAGLAVAIFGSPFMASERAADEPLPPQVSSSSDPNVDQGSAAKDTSGGPTTVDDSSTMDHNLRAWACVDRRTVSLIECSHRVAAVVVPSDNCSTGAVMGLLNVDPALDALLLRTQAVSDYCLTWPSETAANMGASALEVAGARSGSIAESLRECSSADGGTTSSCAEPHAQEWIGSWQPLSAAASLVDDTCRNAAVRYTNNSLVDPDELLASRSFMRIVNGDRQFRCAVGLRKSGILLEGSVREIGSSPLPLAGDTE